MFKELLSYIRNNLEAELFINGEKKTIKGAATFLSNNMPKDPYIKVSFTDDSGLVLLLKDELMYYSPSHLRNLSLVKDNEIGIIEKIEYENKEYILVNKDDYQFVTELLRGTSKDIEGECRFSDYMATDGKFMLSLGWNSFTGQRDDAHAVLLESALIEIKKS